MNTLRIETQTPYDVQVGRGLLKDVGALLARVRKTGRVHLISDANVAPLYANSVETSLTEAGFHLAHTILPAGEHSKSTGVLIELLEQWADQELQRGDLALALGGGVIGDLTGFAAAVYQRGMDFIQVPTSFLAAIDSSVGGKTGVNLKAGKNLVGAFHQPRLVVCDVDTFSTLSPLHFKEGVAEAIKYGILADEVLFDRLAASPLSPQSDDLEDIILSCIRHKAFFVQEDTFDLGLRQKLNLGHTVAHAIEYLSDFKTSHGEAVAQGLLLISRASERSGIAQAGTAMRVEQALARYDLAKPTDFLPEELALACHRDKKARGTSITLVLPERIGAARLESMPFDKLATFFALGKEPL